MKDRYFTQESFQFLNRLADNNRRDWFEQHKQEYEEAVRIPALRFISDIADELSYISPHFLALPRKMGGSLMRVYRDTRFSRDKTPYKTNIGMQFRHESGKDVHAPGFYLHIEPAGCFVGVGIWRPDSATLDKIRKAISEDSANWLKASRDKPFMKKFQLAGESLCNPPRGYSKDHPMLADLKRKDFIGVAMLNDDAVISNRLRKQVIDYYRDAAPFMKFLCKAVEVRF